MRKKWHMLESRTHWDSLAVTFRCCQRLLNSGFDKHLVGLFQPDDSMGTAVSVLAMGTQLTPQGLSSLMNLEVRLNVHIFILSRTRTCLQKTYVYVMSSLGFQRSSEWTQVLSGHLSRSQLNTVHNDQKKLLALPVYVFCVIFEASERVSELLPHYQIFSCIIFQIFQSNQCVFKWTYYLTALASQIPIFHPTLYAVQTVVLFLVWD